MNFHAKTAFYISAIFVVIYLACLGIGQKELLSFAVPMIGIFGFIICGLYISRDHFKTAVLTIVFWQFIGAAAHYVLNIAA